MKNPFWERIHGSFKYCFKIKILSQYYNLQRVKISKQNSFSTDYGGATSGEPMDLIRVAL
jgi:hypothetical protein